MKRTEVLHSKRGAKSVDDGCEKSGGGSCENNVIYVEKEVGSVRAVVVCKERGIRFGGKETNGAGMVGKPLKPSTGCLFNTIERLLKFANMGGKTRVNKTRGFLAIDIFGEVTMEKGVFDIKLVDGPLLRKSKR
jgi:hypothetical protein